MTRPPRRTLALVALAALLLVAAVDATAARPPPEPLCGACGDGFADEAADHDVALAVTHSTASVAVHGNGTATWTVRNRLAAADTADRLRGNHTLLTRIAADAMRDAALLAARVDDRTVVVRFRDSRFAWSSVGGVLVSGALTETHGYPTLSGLGADTLTVTAPTGMRVDRAPAAGRVSADGSRVTFDSLDEGLLVFTPADATLAPVWSVLAVAALYAPGFAAGALLLGLPVGLFAVAAAAASTRWTPPTRRNAVPPLLVASGVLLSALAVLVRDVLVLGADALPAPWLGLTVAALGVLFATRPSTAPVSYAATLGVAAAGTLATWVPTAVTAAAAGDPLAAAPALPATAAVFALLPTGYAVGAGDRRFAAATAVLVAVLATLPALDVALAPGATSGTAFAMVAVAVAVVVVPVLGAAVVGLPLLVAGAVLGATPTT